LGWQSYGISENVFISIAGFGHDTAKGDGTAVDDLATKEFDWWQWGRVTDDKVNGNYNVIKVVGIDPTNAILAGNGITFADAWTKENDSLLRLSKYQKAIFTSPEPVAANLDIYEVGDNVTGFDVWITYRTPAEPWWHMDVAACILGQTGNPTAPIQDLNNASLVNIATVINNGNKLEMEIVDSGQVVLKQGGVYADPTQYQDVVMFIRPVGSVFDTPGALGLSKYVPYNIGVENINYSYVEGGPQLVTVETSTEHGLVIFDRVSIIGLAAHWDVAGNPGGANTNWFGWGRVTSILSPTSFITDISEHPNLHPSSPDFLGAPDEITYTLPTAYIETIPGEACGSVGKVLPGSDGVAKYFGFPETSRFRLHWTAYRGQLETYLSNTNIHTSYADFAFAPAYTVSGLGPSGDEVINNAGEGKWNADPFTHYPYAIKTSLTSTSTFPIGQFTMTEDNIIPNVVYTNPYHGDSYATNSKKFPRYNPVRWAILRLATPFQIANVDGETTLVHQKPSAAVSMFHSTFGTTFIDTDANKYEDGTVSSLFNVVGGVGGHQYNLAHYIPFGTREFKWEEVGHPTLTTYTHPADPNLMGARGFSIPTYIEADTSSVLQVYKPAEYSGKGAITVSDIPGSFPFTDQFVGPLSVEADKIHLGGMTDVYIKGQTPDEGFVAFSVTTRDVSKPPLLPPKEHIDNPHYDILVYGTDGEVFAKEQVGGGIHPDKGLILRTGQLVTGLGQSGLENVNKFKQYDDMVLEILDSTNTAIKYKTFNILEVDKDQGGYVRVGVDLDADGFGLKDIKYRVLRSATNSISEPFEYLAKGQDLKIKLESSTVYTESTFAIDSEVLGPKTLEILTGTNKGKYSIEEFTADKITLSVEANLNGPEKGIHYQVYVEYPGVHLPLIRLKTIELSSDDGTGISIPRKESVGVLAESFSGLNNDPIEIFGKLTLRPGGDYVGTDPSHRTPTLPD
jgi:hypothetical protein